MVAEQIKRGEHWVQVKRVIGIFIVNDILIPEEKEKGLAAGEAKGREEGLAQGEAKGRIAEEKARLEKLEAARKLKARGFPDEEIAGILQIAIGDIAGF